MYTYVYRYTQILSVVEVHNRLTSGPPPHSQALPDLRRSYMKCMSIQNISGNEVYYTA